MGEFVIERYEEYRAKHTKVKNWWVILLISNDNGEHTDILTTDEPRKCFEKLPKHDSGKKWDIGALINVGDQLQAQQISKQITGDIQQIRGAMSRTAMISLLAEKYNLEGYSDMNVVFKIPGAEQRLERI